MNQEQFLEYLSKHNKAKELSQQGIEQFNEGNIEEALSLFEESREINPMAIPNLLYNSLCRFSLIQSKSEDMLTPMFIAHREMQADIQGIISNLELVINSLKLIQFH